MKPITSINLKFWLPFIALSLSAGLYLLTFSFQWHDEKHHAFVNSEAQVNFDMTSLARQIDQLFSRNEPESVAELLAYRSVNSNYKALFLFDTTTQKIVATGVRSPVNEQYLTLNAADRNLIKQFSDDRTSKIRSDRSSNMIHSYFSIADPNSIYLNDRNIVLISRFSLEAQIAQIRQLLYKRNTITGFLYVTFALTLIFFYHWFFKRPYNRLIHAVHQFSTEPQTIDPMITGNGEFAKMASVFKQMSNDIDSQIKQTITARSAADRGTQIINSIFSAIPDLFFILDRELRIIDYRASSKKYLYAPPSSFLNKCMHQVLPKEVGDLFVEHTKKCLTDKTLVTFEYELEVEKSCEVFEARLAEIPKSSEFIVVVRNITEKKRDEEIIERQAFYDSLTGLPNRYLALDRLEKITLNNKGETTSAVVFIDLDDFKNINDTLGHDVGDAILLETAYRLSTLVQETDTVARLGGDEFVLLLEQANSIAEISNLMDKIITNICQPYSHHGRELLFSISIGIAMHPNNGKDSKTLLRKADIAMYHAKAQGKNQFAFFTESMNRKMVRRVEIERQMAGALERDEFCVNFQPQFELCTNTLVGAEALLRWENRQLGHIYPSEFIPIAEQNGMIEEIGRFAIAQSLKAAKQFHQKLNTNLRIAINLSPRQIRDETLIEYIDQQIEEQQIHQPNIEFEITEGVLLSNAAKVRSFLDSLQARNISLALDDFGTGYSSLHYLQEYPFDMVKIDRSFILKMQTSEQSFELVRAIVSMAHQLRLKVLAEGVETKQQLSLLKGLNCNYIQGYYMGQAVTPDEFLKLWTDPDKILSLLNEKELHVS